MCPRPLQVDLWPFDFESSVRVTCDVGYICDNFSFSRPLCSRLRTDVCDRQTDVRQMSDAHHRLIPIVPTRGGHNKLKHGCIDNSINGEYSRPDGRLARRRGSGMASCAPLKSATVSPVQSSQSSHLSSGDLNGRQSVVLGRGWVTELNVRRLVVDVIDDDSRMTWWRHVRRVMTPVSHRDARVKLSVETFHQLHEHWLTVYEQVVSVLQLWLVTYIHTLQVM